VGFMADILFLSCIYSLIIQFSITDLIKVWRLRIPRFLVLFLDFFKKRLLDYII
jgi:hypothetical protein